MIHRVVPPLARYVPGALAIGFALFVACDSASDASSSGGTSSGTTSGGSTSTSSGSSSSGGLDAAAAPDGPIECGPPPGAAAPFTKQALLGAATACASWHACSFQNAATALRTSVRAGDATSSQAAWRVAMNEASKLELFRFGPYGSRAVDPYHGRGLRSFIHPWPDLSRCEVEKQVVLKDYAKGWDVVFPSARGLYGLEYLLFYPGSDTACLPASSAGKAWTALAPDALGAAKSAYANALAENLVSLALELRNVWAPEGEGFGAKLAAAEGYPSEQEALNVVAWSLFYPEQEIKDDKLASLAGIQTTPPNRETPFAKVDIENIRTNLTAFRSLFLGCGADNAGIGFDDWLLAAGHGDLLASITSALAGAQAAADAFPAFDAATEVQFKDLYESLRVLSNLLKGSLFGSASPLNLKLPQSAASDTD